MPHRWVRRRPLGHFHPDQDGRNDTRRRRCRSRCHLFRTENVSMKSKKIDGGTVLVFDTGEEFVSTLTDFARQSHIAAAHFTAIGAFSDAGLGYFDLHTKDYLKNQVKEQVEVVSLIG